MGLEPRAPRAQRFIQRRMIIHCTLVLETPTHLGNGDSEGATDMALLRDTISDQALLPGDSIAGALRNYLRGYQQGYKQREPEQQSFDLKGLAELLFGGRKGDDLGFQSPLVVNDALSDTLPNIELRDGVRINSHTRTPDDQGKYDLELLAAGTRFPLIFELAIGDLPPDANDYGAMTPAAYQEALLEAMSIALRGLEQGAIGIGMKKRRGFGRCHATEWKVWDFDLDQPADLIAWLAFDRGYGGSYHRTATTLDTLFMPSQRRDAQRRVRLTATFGIEGSLLIRAGQDEGAFGPDVRHLHALQLDGVERPVISGTSLAGVLRHQAERIANTLHPHSGTAFVGRMFGCVGQSIRRSGASGQASRLVVHESIVTDARTDLVQNRVSIDRFTGGALDGALFNEQPAFATPETRASLTLDLYDPCDGEIGMLLLLLKDLWTGALPLGSERSIGRGYLRGLNAELREGDTLIAIFAGDGSRVQLTAGDRETLNARVAEIPSALAVLRGNES